jgi:GntR family transcriptional repressor for pyruvate dehydrogenase complex
LLIPTERRPRVRDFVVESFLSAIQRGELQPGERLPSERALAATFKVSRTSLREGLRRLELLGCLDARPGGGTFIRVPDAAVVSAPFQGVLAGIPQAARDLLEFRQALEPQVAAFAAERASAGQLTLLWASLDRQYRALERDQKLAAEDQAFHHLIAEIAGNTVILNVLETLAHLMRHLREQGLSEREPELTIREHVNILNAIARREPELARASMVLHLNTVVHSAAGVHQSRAE